MNTLKEKTNTAYGPRSQERFEREAKALRKNLEKRKRQQQAREKLKEKDDGHGQD